MLGYLREDSETALKSGVDRDTKLNRTGLNEYLKIIFPNIYDWVHNQKIGGDIKEIRNKRPDYRSEQLKLLIEFDGLPHYQNPAQIKSDYNRVKLYSKYGYKLIRIPYFIQLTKKSVKTLFSVDCDSVELFNENIPSLTIHSACTPAYLCIDGIKRMADEFKNFPEQYQTNLKYLKSQPKDLNHLTGVEYLEYFYNKK